MSRATRWLWPAIERRHILPMLRFAALGALIAGAFGVVHDQVTYTLGPEYFTRLKFRQFAWADLGLPPRLFVVEIGFLASCWVGFFVGWFLARVAVPRFTPAEAESKVSRGFAITFGCAVAGALTGWLIGHALIASPPAFIAQLASTSAVEDLAGFTRVACIHYGTYFGAATGLLISLGTTRRSHLHH